MAIKARHLRRGVQYTDITVDNLFKAAFGRTPREYQRMSLLGWRPLSPDFTDLLFKVAKRPPDAGQRPFVPPPGVKLHETKELIVVEVELPPIDQESLYIEITGDLLIIRGTLIPASAQKRSKAWKRAGKNVHRYIQLPVFARPGEVRARLEGNTVRVLIHKKTCEIEP